VFLAFEIVLGTSLCRNLATLIALLTANQSGKPKFHIPISRKQSIGREKKLHDAASYCEA
jgi:hypothetical protein